MYKETNVTQLNCYRLYPPLLWLGPKHADICDSKEDIKKWIKGFDNKFCYRDLITDHNCVAGFESDIIIYLAEYAEWQYMSMCRGQFIHIP